MPLSHVFDLKDGGMANFAFVKQVASTRNCAVNLARWVTRRNLLVILKVYDSSTLSEFKMKAALREAQTPVSLRSTGVPNVCKTFWAFSQASFFIIVQQYCEQGSLLQYFRSRGFAMTEQEACCMVALPMLVTLWHLHQRDIVHADIKIDNIFITHNRAMLGDFGMTQTVRGKIKSYMGTTEFMAPEILQLRRPAGMDDDTFKRHRSTLRGFDHEADIWALGVVLYECLCGHRPWPSKEEDAVISDIVHLNLRKFPPQVAPLARDFVMQMLTPDPDKRPTATALLSHAWVLRHIGFVIKHVQQQQMRLQREVALALGDGNVAKSVLQSVSSILDFSAIEDDGGADPGGQAHAAAPTGSTLPSATSMLGGIFAPTGVSRDVFASTAFAAESLKTLNTPPGRMYASELTNTLPARDVGNGGGSPVSGLHASRSNLSNALFAPLAHPHAPNALREHPLHSQPTPHRFPPTVAMLDGAAAAFTNNSTHVLHCPRLDAGMLPEERLPAEYADTRYATYSSLPLSHASHASLPTQPQRSPGSLSTLQRLTRAAIAHHLNHPCSNSHATTSTSTIGSALAAGACATGACAFAAASSLSHEAPPPPHLTRDPSGAMRSRTGSSHGELPPPTLGSTASLLQSFTVGPPGGLAGPMRPGSARLNELPMTVMSTVAEVASLQARPTIGGMLEEQGNAGLGLPHIEAHVHGMARLHVASGPKAADNEDEETLGNELTRRQMQESSSSFGDAFEVDGKVEDVMGQCET